MNKYTVIIKHFYSSERIEVENVTANSAAEAIEEAKKGLEFEIEEDFI